MIIDFKLFTESLDLNGNDKPPYQPAIEFDKRYGTHVSQKYHMPKGYTEHTLEAVMSASLRSDGKSFPTGKWIPLTDEQVQELYVEMVDLNPSLRGITVESTEDMIHVMFGCTTALNARDIAYFLGVHSKRESQAAKLAYFAECDKQLGGMEHQWVMSPETVKDVLVQTGRAAVVEAKSYGVKVGTGDRVWVYHWITGEPVVAEIVERIGGYVVLDFDFEGSQLAGCPRCRVRKTSVIGGVK